MTCPDKAHWWDAEKAEWKELWKNKCFRWVDRPEGVKILPSKMVYKRKPDRFKARCTAQGCSQAPGDIGETSAPVCRIDTVRTLDPARGASAGGSEQQQRGWRLATQGGSLRFEGAGGPGSGTPWPKLQAESRADVDKEGVAAESGTDGRSMGEGRLQGDVVCGVGTGGAGTAGSFRGPSPFAPFAGSQADVARADGSADGLEDVSGGEWKWWYHRNRRQALLFGIRQADGTTSGFWGPELLIDVGRLALWAMGADRRAITKQEAALTMLRTMMMRARANGEGQR